MRLTSIYEVICDCGETVQGETTEMVCGKCGQAIRVLWPCVTKIEADGRVTA